MTRQVLAFLLAAGGMSLAHPEPAAGVGTWTPTSNAGAAAGREFHTAVWSGSGMIVWGGYGGTPVADLNSGGIYDPATNQWTATSTTGAPAARGSHTAVWTGSKMIVWGGWASNVPLDTGGLYDPVTDAWTATSTSGAPSPRVWHTAVWTGSKMIVWGGMNLSTGTYFNTGGIYDPATDAWAAVSTVGVPTARRFHTAVWTGSRMIVWGGHDDTGIVATGRSYDPATDTWAPISTAGAPIGRFSHTAVWAGSRMVVWGGFESVSNPSGTGGIYDPATNSWAPLTVTGAPMSRREHTAVWTGSRMVVWGGAHESMVPSYDTGGIYDPATNSWAPTPTAGAPVPRADHVAVWTGSQMIIWGGNSRAGLLYSTGGVYDDPRAFPSATDFYTVTPCRLVDTRTVDGPTGGPMLGGKSMRSFPVTGGICGIPTTAFAVSVNLSAVGAAAAGYLALYPGDAALPPLVSNLNFSAAQTRANNAIVLLAGDGTGTIGVRNGSAGAVHFVLDVNGYFQ